MLHDRLPYPNRFPRAFAALAKNRGLLVSRLQQSDVRVSYGRKKSGLAVGLGYGLHKKGGRLFLQAFLITENCYLGRQPLDFDGWGLASKEK